MFRDYFKIAIRHLLKNKTYSLITILGLSIAFICSIFLFLNAVNELSYDQFLPDKERVFKLYHYSINGDGEEFGSSMSYPVSRTVKAEIPEVEASTRYLWMGGGVEYKGKLMDLQVNLVDNDFLKVFAFPVASGNTTNPLSNIGHVVLSESAAKTIFNQEDPIGKIMKIKISGQWKDLMVSAILKDAPLNSSIHFEVLARTELAADYEESKNDWGRQHHEVYVKIASNSTPQRVEEKLRYILKKYYPDDAEEMKASGYKTDSKGDYYSLRLLPFTENHFNEAIGSGNNVVSRTYIYTLVLISFFILAIACFNFINLNIAQAFTRAKEVGVRKCLGADRRQLFMQVWGESLFVCLMALLIGLVASVLLFKWFNQVFGSKLNLSFFTDPSTILVIILSTLVVSFMAGGYPAFFISKLNTISILKGNVSIKKPGIFRNSLIVIQFSMACILMGCTLVAYKQFNYMRSIPLGFNKESVINIPLYDRTNGKNLLNQFRNRLSSQTSVVSISGSNINIGLGNDGNISKRSSTFRYQDKNLNSNLVTVDYDFLQTMGIKLLRGRDFSRSFGTDTISSVIVTESLAKQFMLKDPIGTTFFIDSAKPSTIIGIIPDFHLYSVHEKIEPVSLDISNDHGIGYIFIKINSHKPLEVMNMVKEVYKSIEPDREFRGSFIDENTDRWYNKEKSFSLLLGVSSLIAVILSCLGLFALALLMIQQRIKEIGVRKVLGASVLNINILLGKEFLKLVVIAIVIASPISWLAMSNWLQKFPYHIDLNFGIFFMVGLVALCIALLTVSFHTIKAAMSNPVKSLRTE